MSIETVPHTSVYQAFASAARAQGSRPAILFDGQTVSFSDLAAQVDNAARHLRRLGVGQGSVFAVFSQNCPEQLVLYYAAAKTGAVIVPVNPHVTAAEAAHAVLHSGAAVLFHDAAAADAAAQAARPEALRPLSLLQEAAAGDNAAAAVAPGDDFLIIYTSGSTGQPKAIVLDHAAEIAAPLALDRMWGLTADDRTLVALPLGYLYGLATAAGAALQRGATVVLLRKFHPRAVLEAIVEHRIAVFHGVPTMFSMMLDYAEQHGVRPDLSGMRAAICAGAPLTRELRRRFTEYFRMPLQDYYAMTEATPVFGRHAGDPRPIPEGSAGLLAPGAIARILHSDGTECDTGEAGELFVRAAATLSRYLGDPALTAASLRDGMFRSGDLVRCDADGFYYVVGRIKDVIIRGGANIAPAEVEKVLMSHPCVQDVAVVGAPDRTFGEVPVAFVVRRAGLAVSADDLIAHAAEHISDFKIPRTIHFETALPQGNTGKVDKKLLKQRCEHAARADAGRE